MNGRYYHDRYEFTAEPSKMKRPELQPISMDPSLIDNMLTHEMENLSFKDRNDIFEEIHGVASLDVEETPDLIQQSLMAMNMEIDRIKHKYIAYTEATKSYNPFAHGMDIRLRFLRCDLFDVSEAAQRMMRYLDLTQELYGDIALIRPIQLCDLGNQEMEMLRDGEAQPMPFRDRSGRRLIVAMNNFGLQYPLEVRVCNIQHNQKQHYRPTFVELPTVIAYALYFLSCSNFSQNFLPPFCFIVF